LIPSREREDRVREEGVIGLLYLNLRLLSNRGMIGISVKYIYPNYEFSCTIYLNLISGFIIITEMPTFHHSIPNNPSYLWPIYGG
jgi:hypothetical protein